MNKTTNAKKRKGIISAKPALKWQTGAYSRHANFKLILPYPFLLLCRLTDVTPEQLIIDFTDNLACGSWKREGREKAKEHLINYFIEHGYGQHDYTTEDIHCIFVELDAVGMLFPANGKTKMVNLYSKWRNKHYIWWFKKWFYRYFRKPAQTGNT